MTRHNAALCLPRERDDAPDIIPDHSEAETEHRQFPAAYALYASDIYSGAHAVGVAALNLNAAMMKRDAMAVQSLAEFCAAEAARIQSVSEILARRMSELRKRNPLSKV